MAEKKSRAGMKSRLWPTLKGEKEKRWLQGNSAAIVSINRFIEKHGLLASRLRYRPNHG